MISVIYIILLLLDRDLISRSVVLSLQQNDTVTLSAAYIMMSIKDKSFWLSFKGFMYAPLHQLSVAWSAHVTNNEDANGAAICDYPPLLDICRIIANITFTKISVNAGDVWSSTTNGAIIPVRGFYYITFVLASTKCHLEASLFVNDSASTSIAKTACGTSSYLITRERAVLLSLAEKDIITVKIIKGTVATFRDRFLTSFAGILIYPL